MVLVAIAPEVEVAVIELAGIAEVKSYSVLDGLGAVGHVSTVESVARCSCELIGLRKNSGYRIREQGAVNAVHDDLNDLSFVVLCYP